MQRLLSQPHCLGATCRLHKLLQKTVKYSLYLLYTTRHPRIKPPFTSHLPNHRHKYPSPPGILTYHVTQTNMAVLVMWLKCIINIWPQHEDGGRPVLARLSTGAGFLGVIKPGIRVLPQGILGPFWVVRRLHCYMKYLNYQNNVIHACCSKQMYTRL